MYLLSNKRMLLDNKWYCPIVHLHLAKFDHSLTCQNLILAFLHNNIHYEYLSILLFSTSLFAKISSIFDNCPDRLTMRFIDKLYILWKSLFHWICSKFYKFKYGHDFFLTSDLIKAVRGQKHSSEAKKGTKELSYWKKCLIKFAQQPQKPLLRTH